MDTQTVRIFLTGKIEPGQEIKWNMAPLPVDVDPIDAAADAAFDAPCTISFFDHLIGCCRHLSEAVEFISRAMLQQGGIGTSHDYFWDGFYSEIEGKPLAAMENDYQVTGWWASRMTNGEQASEQQDARDDEDFWRKGC
jgi:hypothetical protein